MPKTLTLILLGIALVAGLTRPIRAAEISAASAVVGLQNAIDTNDASLVETYLDINSTLGRLVDDALPLLNAAVTSGELRLDSTLAAILAGLNSNNMGRVAATMLLTSETRKFILYGVRSGSFSGHPSPEKGGDGGLFLIYGNISVARKEFRSSSVMRQQDKEAILHTVLFDQGSGGIYPLTLDARREFGVWRIKGILNVEELTSQLLQEAGGHQR